MKNEQLRFVFLFSISNFAIPTIFNTFALHKSLQRYSINNEN